MQWNIYIICDTSTEKMFIYCTLYIIILIIIIITMHTMQSDIRFNSFLMAGGLDNFNISYRKSRILHGCSPGGINTYFDALGLGFYFKLCSEI